MSNNKIIALGLFFLSFFLIINLSRDIIRLTKIEKELVKTGQELELIKKQNEDLQKINQYYQSDEFLEKQIRDKLQMAKPEEAILILPESLKQASRSSAKQNLNKEIKKIPNWQKWLGLFK